MEIIKGDGKLLENIDLCPANVYQEVIQSIAVILDTVMQSAVMMRSLGLPGKLLGRPLPVIENILVGYIYDQIEENEPRAILGNVHFEMTNDEKIAGKVIPIIELEGVRTFDD